MAPTQTSTQLAVSSEALELSVPVQTLSAVSNGRESEPSAWLAAHAAGRRWSESWMRAIRTSSSMRGRWKRATTQRASALLYRSPWLVSFCRETLEMGVFQGVRAYAEALEWLSWLRSGTDQEGKKVSRRVRGGRNRHK